jgi:hypothetical protein
MDAPPEKRSRLDRTTFRPFPRTRRQMIFELLDTEVLVCVPPELLQIIVEYSDNTVRTFTRRPVTCPVEHNVLILSGGRSMLALLEGSTVNLVQLEDMTITKHIELPWKYYLVLPLWLQYDQDHVLFFDSFRCVIWNMKKDLVSDAFALCTDDQKAFFTSDLLDVSSYGHLIAGRDPDHPDTHVLLQISIQDETPSFHVVATIDLRQRATLGDKFIFSGNECDRYAPVELKSHWRQKKFAALRYNIKGEDNLIVEDSISLSYRNADESKSFWDIPSMVGSGVAEGLNEFQILIREEFDANDEVWLLSRDSGEVVPIKFGREVSIIACHDNTVFGKVGSKFCVLRFF